MKILSFNTESECDIATKQIWINYIEYYIDNDETILNSDDNQVTDLTGYTDDQIFALKICSKRNDIAMLNRCFNTAYHPAVKAYEIDKWYIKEPDSRFMAGVVSHTIQSLPESWREPITP